MKTFLFPPRLAVALKNCLIMLSILFAFSYNASAQMKQWTLPPRQITIPAGGGAATTIALPGSYTPYEVANGAYDENGSLIFYAEATQYFITIYNASGTALTPDLNTLYSSVSGYNYGQIGEELTVIPVPNTCRKFYVIWTAASTSGFTGTAVGYAIIDCTSGVTISQQSTLIDIWGGNTSAIAVSKVTDTQAGSRYLFAMGYSSLNRYAITSTGIASSTVIANGTTIGTNSNYWITSQMVLSPDQTKIAWATGGGFTNKVFQINLSAYAYSSYTSYTLTGDTWLHGIEFNSLSSRIFVSTNNGLKYIEGGAVYTISSSSAYSNCQLGLALSTYIYCTDNTAKYGRINANITTPTVAVASNLTSYPNYATDTYTPINSTCFRLDDEIDGEDYSYFFGVQKAIADFSINGIPIACPSYNQLYNCAAGSMILNNLTTGPATSYSIEVKSATGADCSTTSITYDHLQGGISPFSTYDLKTFDAGYLTTHTGYYIVYLNAYNTCNVSTVQKALIKIDNIGSYAADYKLLYNPTGQCTINPGATCSVAAPVSSLYSPVVCVEFSTGILCEYWMRVWDWGTTCGGAGTFIADGTSSHTAIPGCSTTGLHVLLDYYIYNHPVGVQPTNYTVMNPYHYYKVELNVKNDCGTATKTAWIINNCPTCKWGDQVSSDFLPMNIYPNPAQDEFAVSNLPAGTMQLQILTLHRRVVSTLPANAYPEETRISVPNLSPGMYFLRTVGPTTSVIKFIKN